MEIKEFIQYLDEFKKINKKFLEIQNRIDSMPPKLQELILQFHGTFPATLNHCVRWGEIASRELMEELEDGKRRWEKKLK